MYLGKDNEKDFGNGGLGLEKPLKPWLVLFQWELESFLKTLSGLFNSLN